MRIGYVHGYGNDVRYFYLQSIRTVKDGPEGVPYMELRVSNPGDGPVEVLPATTTFRAGEQLVFLCPENF